MIRAVVSGPFRRAIAETADAVAALREAGADVLSPSDPRIVDAVGDFVFVASDVSRTIRVVEDRHLEAIKQANFLWLVTPDRYVGPSTAFEIGCAVTAGVPIFCKDLPDDLTFRSYVTPVAHERDAVERAAAQQGRPAEHPADCLLLHPAQAAAAARAELDRAERLLTTRSPAAKTRDAALEVSLGRLHRLVSVPAHRDTRLGQRPQRPR